MGEIKSIPKRDKLHLHTMGVSNVCYDPQNKKRFSIQFYDYDKNGSNSIDKEHLRHILEIFPYDCILYETKHGFHFLSFSLLRGSAITKARAISVSKKIGEQDYWSKHKSLTLRVAPKWDISRFRKRYKVISEKPRFVMQIRIPKGFIISNKHLEFYYKFMGLPEEVYKTYWNCDKREYSIGITHYNTRD